MNLIAKETGINSSDIVDLDLSFCDANPATLVGLNQEFISSPRIDNQVSSFFALKAITNPDSYDPDSSFINLICLFDHEEIGSVSAQGADSVMLTNNLERIY